MDTPKVRKTIKREETDIKTGSKVVSLRLVVFNIEVVILAVVSRLIDIGDKEIEKIVEEEIETKVRGNGIDGKVRNAVEVDRNFTLENGLASIQGYRKVQVVRRNLLQGVVGKTGIVRDEVQVIQMKVQKVHGVKKIDNEEETYFEQKA